MDQPALLPFLTSWISILCLFFYPPTDSLLYSFLVTITDTLYLILKIKAFSRVLSLVLFSLFQHLPSFVTPISLALTILLPTRSLILDWDHYSMLDIPTIHSTCTSHWKCPAVSSFSLTSQAFPLWPMDLLWDLPTLQGGLELPDPVPLALAGWI